MFSHNRTVAFGSVNASCLPAINHLKGKLKIQVWSSGKYSEKAARINWRICWNIVNVSACMVNVNHPDYADGRYERNRLGEVLTIHKFRSLGMPVPPLMGFCVNSEIILKAPSTWNFPRRHFSSYQHIQSPSATHTTPEGEKMKELKKKIKLRVFQCVVLLIYSWKK